MITLASKRYTIAAYNNTLDSRYPAGAPITTPEAPRYAVDTTYSLPTGAEHVCTTAAEFTTALSACARGDVITLTAGNTFTGAFTLPTKSGTGWIYIRSSAHASLPAAGTRIAPADAANMPALRCSAAQAAITVAAGATHWRLVGLDIGPTAGQFVTALVTMGSGVTSADDLAAYITLDRCYIHADATLGGRRGVQADAKYFAAVECYISGFREVEADTQAIWVNNTPGPIKIDNCYLEAAGENFMAGGSTVAITDVVPSDVTFTGNYLFKPLDWRYPAVSASDWTVKNLFEIKNGQRMLVKGNRMENNWAGQGQNGFSILVTPRAGGTPNARVRDINFQSNRLKNCCQGFNIAGGDDNAPGVSYSTKHIQIDNNEIEITGASDDGTSNGDKTCFQFIGRGIAETLDGGVMEYVRVTHNTSIHRASGSQSVLLTDDASNFLTFSDNLLHYGSYGIFRVGGTTGSAAFDLAFTTWEMENNAFYPISGVSGSYAASTQFAATEGAVYFTDATGGDFLLTGSSPFKNDATDGTDIGCNIAALEAELND